MTVISVFQRKAPEALSRNACILFVLFMFVTTKMNRFKCIWNMYLQ